MGVSEIKDKMVRLCDLNDQTITSVTDLGRVSLKHVSDIERIYRLKLPKAYAAFLSEYGHWGLDFEVLGIILGESLTFDPVDVTNDYKDDGLPDNCLIIENVDEFQYCLNLKDGSVSTWSPFDGDLMHEFDDFLSYFSSRLDARLEDSE